MTLGIATADSSSSELCTAVETMYSLSYLYQAMGDNSFADRGELAAFNALPVMFSPDWWSHQYVAQPNQPYSRRLTETPFTDVTEFGQTYGLEPHYPCCTVNFPQGYPKFAAASFVKIGDGGLGHALLSPASVTTTLGKDNNVTISCITDYPFQHTLLYSIRATQPFFFSVRVPGWYIAERSSITVTTKTGSSTTVLSPDPATGMHTISLPLGTSTVTYVLGAAMVVQPRANDAVAIRYGALLYALEIKTSVASTRARNWQDHTKYPVDYAPRQARDYVIDSTSPWAVAIDTSTLRLHVHFPTTETLPNPIFVPGAPPTSITVKACEIDWGFSQGVAAEPPPLERRRCTGRVFEARLIPYGAAKLHMAELPTMDLRGVEYL